MNVKHNYTIEQLNEIIITCDTFSEVCRKLSIPVFSGNIKTLKNKCNKNNIDYSHFKGRGWSKDKVIHNTIKIPLFTILVENSNYLGTSRIKKRLIKEGLKEDKCEICGISEWQGKPLSLQLHHINGVNNDHRIENLQILCPNCHTQTDNYGSKNIKSVRETIKLGTDET